MKKMKKSLIIGLMLLSMTGVLPFVACEQPSGDNPPPQPTYSLTLNKESIEIDIFQECYLLAEYSGSEKVEWSVSDPSIVSVENGKLTGLKAGTVTITASAGESKDTCTVVVSAFKENLLKLEAEETNFSMYKGDAKAMALSLEYNGNPISVAVQKSFTSSNPNVVEVSETGTLSAKNFGTAMISAVYSLDQTEVATAVTVSVVSSGKVEIQQGSATIDALGSYAGKQFNNTVTLSAKAYEKGVEQAGANIVWSLEEGQDILSMSGSTFTALNAGTTNVSATYVDIDGVTQTDTIAVTVLPVLVDSKQSIVLSKNQITDGYEVDLSSIVGDSENALTAAWIASIGDIKINLPCDEGKIDFTTISAGEKELCLATRNIIYQVDLELWTVTIDTAADMNLLYEATDGWYRLGGDINMSTTKWAYPTAKEFLGKFDGAGYAIENLTVVGSGLFDTLADSAQVTNITINAKISETATGIGAIARNVKGTNVRIENVSLYVDVLGVSCGGAIGQVSGKLALKNVQGLISNGCGDDSNGALFGSVAYTPTFEEMKIYSTFKICGQSATPDSATVLLNQTPNVIVAPTLLEEKTNIEFDENDSVSVKCGGGEYVSYTSYANSVRVFNESTNSANVLSEDVTNRFGAYVEFLFEKANGEKSYFALPLSSVIHLSNENFVQYIKVDAKLTGDYVLTEDVNLADYPNWTNTAILMGTFDGGNHTITGLKVGVNSGLFKTLNGATVKNVAIVDVDMGRKSGVLAAFAEDAGATVENVYISLAAQLFSEDGSVNYLDEAKEMNIESTNKIGIYGGGGEFKSGVVFQANDNPIVVKNSVIYIPEHLSTASGFVTSYAYYGAAHVENCTFIGGNGRVTGIWEGRNFSKNVVENTIITDAVAAHKTYKATWNEMQKAAYEQDHPLIELNNANIASVIPTLTKEIVVLTENINGATSGLNGINRTKTTFSGVFDGQGKTISNLESNYWDRGMLLCGYLKGSVKNVVIKCSWTVNYDGGVIADEINGGHVENVYVEQTVNTSTADPQKIGAIVHKVTAGSMKNVVAYTVQSNKDGVSGLFGKWNGNGVKNIILENCYYITPNESVSYVGVGTSDMTLENFAKQEQFFGIQGFKGANAKDDFDLAVEGNIVKLTDFIKGVMYPTNN